MKLLLVPDPTSPNAEDAFCRELKDRAAKQGHETRIHAVPNGPLEVTLESLSAIGFSLASDVVLVNSLQPAAIIAARRAGKKVVVRFIDSFAGASEAALAAVRELTSQADLLLLPSRYLESLVRGWGIKTGAAMIPYAYDQIRAQEITLVTLRASRPTGFPLVTSGSFNPATLPSFEVLLTALAKLRLDWHLTVVGNGPSKEALEKKCQQLALADRVVFTGPLPHEKIMEYFRASKAYIDPCGLDGFPMLALHAQSEGCPVIAVRRGAFEEFVTDGENGLLVPPDDPMALSEAIVTLSSVSGLSLKLIGGGIATVEQRSWDTTTAKTLAALESVLAAPPGGSPA